LTFCLFFATLKLSFEAEMRLLLVPDPEGIVLCGEFVGVHAVPVLGRDILTGSYAVGGRTLRIVGELTPLDAALSGVFPMGKT
jgi:hypothetical protein